MNAPAWGFRDRVTIVIAAKNEALTIDAIVKAALAFACEVIVVDGHSQDGTAAAARAAGATVLQDGGRGKGEAIRMAVPHVRTDVTVFVDGDGSHILEDVPRLVDPIASDRADHVSASRLMGGSSELHGGFDEFCRLAGSSFITFCINKRFGVRLSESQNGFRAIRTTTLRQLPLRAVSTTIEQEMIMRTLRCGGRMAEVPSHERPRQHGTSHIRVWRAAPRYLGSLLRNLF